MDTITVKLKMGLLAGVMLVGAGCTAQMRQHGYVPLEDELQQIVPGIDTRVTVEEVIGVPSTAGVQDQGDFYYVQSQVRHFAWQAPEVVDREVLAITFDGDGVVDNIVRYGLEDGQVVPLSRRVTDSAQDDIGFLRKLFGNIGRIRAEDLLGGG